MKTIKLISITAFLFIMTGCYKVIEPGQVGIRVEQTGADRGVQNIPAETGRVFYNPINEYVLEYPTNVQRAIWTASKTEGSSENDEISFQSGDGMHFTGDVAVSYQLVKESVPAFYVKFRNDDLDIFTHGFFRDAVRKSIGMAAINYTAEQINGAKQAELEQVAQGTLETAMKPIGVSIIQLAFTSPPRPPAAVRDAYADKIAAIQNAERVENEKRQAIAEGEKIKALADANAEANRVTSASITPTLIEWQKIQKWDGHNSQVVTGGGGALVNVK